MKRRTAATLAGLTFALVALTAAAHPLDPLSEDEIQLAVALVRADKGFPEGALFPSVVLAEPKKDEVLAWKPGAPERREAAVTILDRRGNRTFEARVDLATKRVLSLRPVEGVQPLVLTEEYDAVPRIVRADPRFIAAMKRRGIDDPSKVWIETWASGNIVPKGQEGARLLRAIFFMRDGAINYYNRPIGGVTAVVNLNSEQVVDFVDTGVVPISPERIEFDEKSLGPLRPDLKPLKGVQPQGPSFTVDGHEVRWQKWRFRFGMHPREGLVLYDVCYEDKGVSRSIIYRAGLSEMVVPYGDPDAAWSWRSAFDEGEYGVGRLASPLEPGIDVPQTARLFDVPFADDFGNAYVLKRVVGLYERDGGLSWKHYDLNHDRNQSRRARELVVSFIATIGNYDYSVAWVFNEDGAIDVEVELTGIMLTKGVQATSAAMHDAAMHHAHLVDKNVAAPHHQHYFNFRIDLDVDGRENSAYELNSRGLPMGPGNPLGNTIVMEETLLARESQAERDLSTATARTWRIGNAKKTNALGYNPSFMLVPGGNTVPFLDPKAPVRRRAGFIDHAVWVTRYKDDERYAAGWYPNQGKLGDGLKAYVKDDEGLAQQDLVLWYTMGITHIPRPEEWPIMTVHRLGFRLIPAGFFDRNPALDLPRSPY